MSESDTVEVVETETQNSKRKRGDLSSISETDTPEKVKTKRRQNRKNKNNTPSDTMDSSSITKQLEEINRKLSNVLTKDDATLKDMIRNAVKVIKEDLMRTVNDRIDKLEGRLFEKEKENDSLKEKIAGISKELRDQMDENDKLKREMSKQKQEANEKLNDLEQYGRRNNLRISGIPEQDQEENENQTTEKVVETLNQRIPDLNLKTSDIDISHRLGKKERQKERQIIVKFVSRMTRDKVIRQRKRFQGTSIYINEDLTKLNQLVLSSIKKKMPDEVDRAWSKGGKLFFRNKTGTVHPVGHHQYDHWIDLPWPSNRAGRG